VKPLGIIFDCDGVLFESRDANLAYYNAVLSAFDVAPVTPEQRERAHLCHTAASPQVFAQLLGEEHLEAALNLAAQSDYRQFIPYMQPEPGMIEALSLLVEQVPLAIATNRGNSMSEILLHFGMNHLFAAIVTSRDVARPKPYPDMLHRAADLLGIPGENLLFIGDSELDAQAAAAAKIPFLAYRSLQPHVPSVQSYRELLDWLLH